MFVCVALGDSGRSIHFNLVDVIFTFRSLKIYKFGTLPVNTFKIYSHALKMKPLELRLRSLLQSFRDHVNERNKELLEPKLMSNAQLSSECADSTMKEVVEQEDFLKFHENLAAGN